MNALSLVQRVARRIPAYDQSEYLDEVNAAYKEVWDYCIQLEESYFTDVKVVTVASQTSAEFDLLANANGNLNNAVSFRLMQITRVRVLQPADTQWNPAHPKDWNDPEFLDLQQITPAPVSTFSPYFYRILGKGSLLFARPMPVGTQLEITYSFGFLPLVIQSNGQVSSSGAVVTGVGTTFTKMVPADFQTALPGNDQDTDVGIELVLDATNQQVYRVKSVASDTSLTTINAVSPAVPANTNYNLASVPDTPDAHHNVISTLATRNFMSTPGNDARFSTWAALAEKELDAMRDTIMIRQRQEPARRQRFPQSLLRYTVIPNTR